MRWIFGLLLVLPVFVSLGQRTHITGQVNNRENRPIVGAHIRNITIDKITVSNQDGKFRITAQSGDTLYFTSIGFEGLQTVVPQSDTSALKIYTLKELAIELNEVEVLSIPPIEQFKDQVLEIKPKDSSAFWYFGVEKPVFKGDKMATGRIHKKLLYAIFQPTSFLYYNLSKKEKERRKYYELRQRIPGVRNAQRKFAREWVKVQTGLDGDELTDFIAFCNFSIRFLDETPLYIIREHLLAKLDDFQNKEGNK